MEPAEEELGVISRRCGRKGLFILTRRLYIPSLSVTFGSPDRQLQFKMGAVTSWRCWFTILTMWILWFPVLLTEDNTVKVTNVSYTSQHMGNCWFNFKYYNITYDDIHLSINNRTILDSDGYVPPVMNFTKSEGFKLEGCQTVSMRCYKDGVETIYKIQVKEEGADNSRDWKIWVAVAVPVFLFLVCSILGLIYCRKVHHRDKHHLPFCCESQAKDPAVEQNLCESQETL
ncbi:uncharacterized protein LOC132380548 [Hypanus sabinus]|uniref:uncharacterized protein LOC132380548 n=1 Tax=Hypanus sabinus TaxID=79690 RepID=UPI0028C45D2D|nr:uncharacterized protein LOC132380548 [Hypanus sabinus]